MRKNLTFDEFVHEPRRLRSLIHHRSERLEFKRAALVPSTSLDELRVQTSLQNTHESRLISLIDEENELNQLLIDLDSVCVEIHDFLFSAVDFRGADILESVYLDETPITAIAERLHYSREHIHRLFKKAQAEAREKYDERRNELEND